MKQRKRKENAFTLIELIATLVIMAIIALIVTPLVMTIIRSARISADKRSIDAYGRSIELAIAGYLLDTGKFPIEVSQLTIEYSGNQVECETTHINSDFSVYLAGCHVAGRNVENYTYGENKTPQASTYTAYQVGDEVTYNNINYYVIKNSSSSEEIVTLLKAEPLAVDEVNQFGAGHVNRYTDSSVGTAYNSSGYGGMAYYSSETCGYVNGSYVDTGCTTDYAQSEVKYVVDAWKIADAPAAIEARLLSKNEYQDNCVEEEYQSSPSEINTKFVPQYDWLASNDYWYWTSTSYNDSLSSVGSVLRGGDLNYTDVYALFSHGSRSAVVRPVIVLPKSALN